MLGSDKGHSLRGAPEALAVLPARALSGVVERAQHRGNGRTLKRPAQPVHVAAGCPCIGGHARLARILRPAAALTHASADRLQQQLPGGAVAPEVARVTGLCARSVLVTIGRRVKLRL